VVRLPPMERLCALLARFARDLFAQKGGRDHWPRVGSGGSGRESAGERGESAVKFPASRLTKLPLDQPLRGLYGNFDYVL